VGADQAVHVDRDDAGHRLDGRDDLGERHWLAEGARGERKAVAQGVDRAREDDGLVIGRVDLDLEANAEGGGAVALQPECDERIARSANRGLEPGQYLVGHRIAVRTRDGQEDAAPLSIPAPGGERLRDARIRAREVLVVEY